MITITIRTANAAFSEGNYDWEVARILEKLAKQIQNNGLTEIPLMDINGNKVGIAKDSAA